MLELVELELDSDYARISDGSNLQVTSTPKFELPKNIQYVESMKISEVSVPLSYYAIQNGTSRLKIDIGPVSIFGPASSDTNYDDTIGVRNYLNVKNGTYNVNELLTYLNAKCAEGLVWWHANDGGYGVAHSIQPTATLIWSYVPTLGKLVLTFDNDGVAFTGFVTLFHMETLDEKLAIVLGWKTSFQFAGQQFYGKTFSFLSGSGQSKAIFEAPVAVQLQGPQVLYLNSKRLGPLVKTVLPRGTFLNGESGTQIAMIPVTANFMEFMTWQDPSETYAFDLRGLSFLEDFDLYFTLGHETAPLDFNGIPFQVKITLQVNVEGGDSHQSTAENARVVKRLRPA